MQYLICCLWGYYTSISPPCLMSISLKLCTTPLGPHLGGSFSQRLSPNVWWSWVVYSHLGEGIAELPEGLRIGWAHPLGILSRKIGSGLCWETRKLHPQAINPQEGEDFSSLLPRGCWCYGGWVGLSAFREKDTPLSLYMESPRPQSPCFTLLEEYPSMVTSHPVIWSGQPSRIWGSLNRSSLLLAAFFLAHSYLPHGSKPLEVLFLSSPHDGVRTQLCKAKHLLSICLPASHISLVVVFSLFSSSLGGFHLQEISFGSFGVFRESKISYVCSVVILDSELNLLLHLS